MTEKQLRSSDVDPLSYRDKEISVETLIAEREVLLEQYRHHLKLVLEANVFIYAVSGAIASFVASHTAISNVRWVLLLPCSVCFAFAVMFVLVSLNFNYVWDELGRIAEGLNTNTVPIVSALPLALRISAILLFVISLLLFAGFWRFPSTNDGSLARFAITSDNSIALDTQTGRLCNAMPPPIDFRSIGGKICNGSGANKRC
jgi:hypothetical protein